MAGHLLFEPSSRFAQEVAVARLDAQLLDAVPILDLLHRPTRTYTIDGMKLMRSLRVTLMVIFALLVLGLGVMAGLVAGVALAGGGVTFDGIVAGAGSMIGAILTVGAALGVFIIQERRAELRRRDEIRPHALALYNEMSEIRSAATILAFELGIESKDGTYTVTKEDCIPILALVLQIAGGLDEAGRIPVPGAAKEIIRLRPLIRDLTSFRNFLEHNEAINRMCVLKIPDGMVKALERLQRTAGDLMMMCDRYL